MRNLLLFSAFLFTCAMPMKQSPYSVLQSYEGTYQYMEESTLDIVASEFDTTLYAVIEDAKYPLQYIALDSFVDVQNSPVVFMRNTEDEVEGYRTDGQTFNLITKDFSRMEMLPRRALFHDPDNFRYVNPTEIGDGLKTGSLKDEFTNPALIEEMIKATIRGTYPEVHSILIYKGDKLVLEEYFYGHSRNDPHPLRSATKPFIGCLLGIAIDEGFVKSEKERLLPYFEAKYKEIDHIDARKNKLTIENFLTYRHGMDCENNNPQSKGNEQTMMQSSDWVKYTLDLPMVLDPGGSSSYCTGCALTLGSLVEIASGQKIENFAKKNLFGPLGISNYKWIFAPDQSSMTTFSQLYLTPRDLIKLAKMYKDDGIWKGQQIISKRWVRKTFDYIDGDYGYLWQHKYFDLDGKRYHSYLASGNGGQKINIWPDLDMITVFTGGNYNSFALYGKSTAPNEMIPQYILRAL